MLYKILNAAINIHLNIDIFITNNNHNLLKKLTHYLHSNTIFFRTFAINYKRYPT